MVMPAGAKHRKNQRHDEQADGKAGDQIGAVCFAEDTEASASPWRRWPE
jgi:hypothetical protein